MVRTNFDNPATQSDNKVVAYSRWVVRWRWPIIIISLLVAAFLASGARNLWFATNYRAFFSKENPQLNSFEALQNIYTKNDNILFVLEPRDGDAFTPEVLAAAEELTQEAWKIPYTIRVDSVTNFQHTRADGDDLIVEDLVADARGRSTEELEAARQCARGTGSLQPSHPRQDACHRCQCHIAIAGREHG